MAHIGNPTLPGRPAIRLLVALGFALMLTACNRTAEVAEVPYPADYRERHPITLREGERTVEVFVGSKRAGLTPAQRADVLAFAQIWRREATSGIVIEAPQNGSAARSAAATMREIHSILAASGVPAGAIAVRGYAVAPGALASIKLSYAKISADAGPCGLWPKD